MYSANSKLESARGKALGDKQKAFEQKDMARAKVVKSKQDAFAKKLKADMDAEISAAQSKGTVVERILNPMTIEMKYTQKLTEGLAKIDADEDYDD